MSQLVCHDCGSTDIGVIVSDDDAQWVGDLRTIAGWDSRGTPYEHLLFRNGWAYQFDEDELALAVDSFASTQEKTLKGYTNLVRAFKNHVNKGYHKATAAPKSGGMLKKDGRYY